MLHIVLLSDEDRIVTDIVAFDDFKQAERVANELSAKYGKNRVQRTSLRVNQLPAFWGLTNETPPNTACTRLCYSRRVLKLNPRSRKAGNANRCTASLQAERFYKMGAFLTCPYCKYDTHVGHWEWSSIVCLNCKKEVKQEHWLIAIGRAAQLRLHLTAATPRKTGENLNSKVARKSRRK